MATSVTDIEKRHFQRIEFVSRINISLDQQSWECVLLDISLKGVLLMPPDDFEAQEDSIYLINLVLNEDTEIKMQAKISHSEGEQLGFKWINIDLDSFTTLRRLLELNIKDADEINRELAGLISSSN